MMTAVGWLRTRTRDHTHARIHTYGRTRVRVVCAGVGACAAYFPVSVKSLPSFTTLFLPMCLSSLASAVFCKTDRDVRSSEPHVQLEKAFYDEAYGDLYLPIISWHLNIKKSVTLGLKRAPSGTMLILIILRKRSHSNCEKKKEHYQGSK